MEYLATTLFAQPLFDLVGMFGVLFYIGSYAALQLGRLDGNSLAYSLLNGCAASLVLISLTRNFNLASAVIQILWITISLVGIWRCMAGKANLSRRAGVLE